MDGLLAIGERHGLAVVEDAAEAHGALYRGRKVGSIGRVGCFSFYAGKIITTGEGGMLTTNDFSIAERAARLRNQAFVEPRFVHQEIGFNYRMSSLQAAVGVAQVARIEQRLAHRRWYAEAYRRRLEPLELVELPAEAPWARSVFWVYGVLLPRRVSVPEVQTSLRRAGVETRRFFCPMNLQPVYSAGGDPRFPDVSGSYPVSEELWERGIFLPSGLRIEEHDVDRVVDALKSALSGKGAG
jgi:perosamine synthetase